MDLVKTELTISVSVAVICTLRFHSQGWKSTNIHFACANRLSVHHGVSNC